jgi:hypothetical protein
MKLDIEFETWMNELHPSGIGTRGRYMKELYSPGKAAEEAWKAAKLTTPRVTKKQVTELIEDCLSRGYGPLFIYTELVSRGILMPEESKVTE